jgi:hypothetical protein
VLTTAYTGTAAMAGFVPWRNDVGSSRRESKIRKCVVQKAIVGAAALVLGRAVDLNGYSYHNIGQ